MATENEKPKTTPQITEEYKILQEIKRLVDTLKETNAKLEFICQNIRRDRGM